MFTELLRKLAGPKLDDPLPELDAQLAVGALLVRVAKSDAHYAVEEIVEIDAFLAHQYGLNPVEAAKMRATCEKLEAQAPDLERFTRMVQDNVTYAERAQVYEGLWQVSVADRALKPVERTFLAQAASALGIDETDISNTAKRHEGQP